ncbi:MAG TPA: MazG nucleotide pyrophosphohydrolase domain-containing protein, partial [Acidimicrobiales bacterium]
LEAIDGLVAVEGDASASPERVERAVTHLEEELGDLLFQVYFHSTLAAEEGRFSLADVARGVHDKLVARHPHVFVDTVANSPDQVATNWEASKLLEKGRASVTEGIPAALPALALAAKLQRKALTVGIDLPDRGLEASAIVAGLDRVLQWADERPAPATGPHSEPDGEPDSEAAVGDLLFSLVSVSRQLGVDHETALRARSVAFRHEVAQHEQGS